MQARIAALAPPERELLERAATMGSVFWLGGLLAIARLESSAARPVVARGGHRRRRAIREHPEGAHRARLHPARCRTARSRTTRSTSSSTTSSARRSSSSRRRARRAATTRRSPIGSRSRTHVAHARGVHGHARAPQRAGRARSSQAARAYLDAARRRARALREQQGRRVLRKGLELAPRRRRGLDASSASARSTTTATCSRSSAGTTRRSPRSARCSPSPTASTCDAKGGAAHSRIGRLYRDTGRLDEARSTSNAALALFEEAGDERGIAVDRRRHRQAPLAARRLREGARVTRSARSRCAASIGDRRSIALSLNNLGPRLPGLGAVQARARRVRAGAPHPPRDRRSRRRRDLAQQPRHRRAGSARRHAARSTLFHEALRGREGDRRSQPHRARPHQPRRDATTASATREGRSTT